MVVGNISKNSSVMVSEFVYNVAIVNDDSFEDGFDTQIGLHT